MVHNGIEYGLMQAYAEGYELLAPPTSSRRSRRLRGLARGTVVRSWLLDLLVDALEEDPDLAVIHGYVEDSGEGRWTVEAAIDHAVPRRSSPPRCSRGSPPAGRLPAMKAVAALRNQFGGHAVAGG